MGSADAMVSLGSPLNPLDPVEAGEGSPLNPLDPVEAGEIIFTAGSPDSPLEVLRFKSNGDILVQGRLAENDKQVVEALRKFLKIEDPKTINGGRTRFERLDDP